MKKLILTLIVVSGCCPAPSFRVEAEFRPYVDSFRSRYNVGEGVTVKRGTLEGSTIGQCEIGVFTSTITIDGEYWDLAADFERESLMYHELGHCLLRRAHTSERDEDGCPSSIMYPTNSVNYCYEQKREQYLTELGQKRNTLGATFVGIDADEPDPIW